MKRKISAVLILLVFAAGMLFAQVDRTVMPAPGPAPAVAFPAYEKFVASNGIRVIVVKDTKLPTIDVQLLIDRKPILEGDYAGYIEIGGQMLRRGTTTHNKDQLDNAIELIGGSIRSSGTSVFASGLSRSTEDLVKLMAEVVLQPTFPQDELDKVIEQTVSGLKYRKTEPTAIVEVIRGKILFGEGHPYGEVETEETVKKVTREKCLEMYNTYFKPNAAIMAFVGDIDAGKAMGLVEKYFGGWQQGTLPAPLYADPRPLPAVTVALVDRADAPQSVVRVSEAISLARTSPDVVPVTVMNTILGGGSAFRLFTNLREKHAYTYGAYSSMNPDELMGSFTAMTSAKSAVTDSAITEILRETRRIRDEKVGETELQMAKNFASGSFVRSLENPETIAEYAINIERYKLPSTYYQEYLRKIDMVSVDEVQRVARTYIDPEKLLVAVVGPAASVKAKLAAFGPVSMYDEDGKPVVVRPAEALTITAGEILDKFIERTGGKARWSALKDMSLHMSARVQNFDLKILTVKKAPNKLYQEVIIGTMGTQRLGFDGKKGWASTPQGIMDLSGDQLESVRRMAAMNFYIGYTKLGLTAKVTGSKTIAGEDTYEVTFSNAKGPVSRHYFSTSDFLKVREVKLVDTPQGAAEETTELAAYKDFSGYLLPSRYGESAMGQAIDLSLDSCEINHGVADNTFRKPAGK